MEPHSQGKEIRSLDLPSRTSTLFSDDAKNRDIAWRQNEQVLYGSERVKGDDGGVVWRCCWGEEVGLHSPKSSFV